MTVVDELFILNKYFQTLFHIIEDLLNSAINKH